MTFNNTQKLLAGALTLVLVAGMTSPAFAGGFGGSCTITQNQMVRIQIAANEQVQIQKTIECDFKIIGLAQGPDTCEFNSALGWQNLVLNENFITFDEVIENNGDTSEDHCTVMWDVLGVDDEDIRVTEENWINEPQVAGELLPLDSSALMIAGLTSMSVWMVPTVLGLAGVGVYLVKFRKH